MTQTSTQPSETLLSEARLQQSVSEIAPTINRIHRLILGFILLLVVEGALRKWFLSPFQLPLLFVRVPVELYLVYLGYRSALLRSRVPLIFLMWLGAFSVALSLYVSPRVPVSLFGWVADFLPAPVAYAIGLTISSTDILKIARFFWLISLPHAILMVLQYASAPTSRINATPDQIGTQLALGGGHVRAAGLFSQTIGTAYFYTLIFALALGMSLTLRSDRLPRILGLCGVIVGLVSGGSRTAWLSCAIVALFYTAFTLLRNTRRAPLLLASFVLIATVGGLMVANIPTLSDALRVFQESRLSQNADLQGRVLDNFLQPFVEAETGPILGHGLGIGTSVGAKLAGVGSIYQFGDAEVEWIRHIVESGPILGGIYLAFRAALAVFLCCIALFRSGVSSLTAALTGAFIPLDYFAQLGQMTENGFFVLTLGLLIASLRADGLFRSREKVNHL